MSEVRRLWQGRGMYGDYEVVEQQYNRRPARLLFSGQRQAVQSGIALDGRPELLFDYNQRFMELTGAVRPRRVLLIGGGAFTLPMALLATYNEVVMDVVEPDARLLSIATRYFWFKPHARLNVCFGDGRTFIEHISEPYDLILVDAFSNLAIPASLSDDGATIAMRRALTAGGLVAVNVVSPYYGRQSSVIRAQLAAYRAAFGRVDVYPADSTDSGWQQQNLVLVASVSAVPAPLMRYRPLPPLGADN